MKKFELNLDELAVESFATDIAPEQKGTVHGYSDGTGCDTMDACCMAGTHGGVTCDTTCNQILCGCSAGPSDCDATCAGYWNAEQMSCLSCPYGCN